MKMHDTHTIACDIITTMRLNATLDCVSLWFAQFCFLFYTTRFILLHVKHTFALYNCNIFQMFLNKNELKMKWNVLFLCANFCMDKFAYLAHKCFMCALTNKNIRENPLGQAKRWIGWMYLVNWWIRPMCIFTFLNYLLT